MGQVERIQQSVEMRKFDRTDSKRSRLGRDTIELDEGALDEGGTGEQLHNVVSLEDVPPNGGYGWICTGCVFLINAHTWGINAVSLDKCLSVK